MIDEITEVDRSNVPKEIKKWNWAAFLLTFIWGLSNKVWISLLTLIPVVNIVMPFVLGAKGNEWAWKKGTGTDLQHFKKIQKYWTYAALIFVAIIIAILLFFAITALVIFFVITNSTVYKDSYRLVQNNPATIEVLGQPIESGLIIMGSIKTSGSSGNAELSYSVSGPKNGGNVIVKAVRSSNKWSYQELTLTIKGSDEIIDILKSEDSITDTTPPSMTHNSVSVLNILTDFSNNVRDDLQGMAGDYIKIIDWMDGKTKDVPGKFFNKTFIEQDYINLKNQIDNDRNNDQNVRESIDKIANATLAVFQNYIKAATDIEDYFRFMKYKKDGSKQELNGLMAEYEKLFIFAFMSLKDISAEALTHNKQGADKLLKSDNPDERMLGILKASYLESMDMMYKFIDIQNNEGLNAASQSFEIYLTKMNEYKNAFSKTEVSQGMNPVRQTALDTYWLWILEYEKTIKEGIIHLGAGKWNKQKDYNRAVNSQFTNVVSGINMLTQLFNSHRSLMQHSQTQ